MYALYVTTYQRSIVEKSVSNVAYKLWNEDSSDSQAEFFADTHPLLWAYKLPHTHISTTKTYYKCGYLLNQEPQTY